MDKLDWHAWHDRYDDPRSQVSIRLRAVQGHVNRHLDRTGDAPLRIMSMCAGDGRDVIQVASDRDDSYRLSATLIEIEGRNVLRARAAIAQAGLANFDVWETDARRTTSYIGAVPADLIVISGVFGNIDDASIRAIIETLPEMCHPGALVIWTRRRHPAALIATIDAWFSAAGFADESVGGQDAHIFFVGAHRFTGVPRPLGPERMLFEVMGGHQTK